MHNAPYVQLHYLPPRRYFTCEWSTVCRRHAHIIALQVTGLRQLLVAVLGASLLLLPLLVSRRITDPAGNRTPPGPLLRRPFLGKYPERLFQKWHETYGPLFSLWLGNQLFVLVSDPVTAKELFVTNGAIFSGRKLYFMKNQTILRGRAITASQYGSKWYVAAVLPCQRAERRRRRQHRRIAMTLLTPKAIEGYAHVLDYEAHILIKSLYNAAEGGNLPVNPAHYAGRYALKCVSASSQSGSRAHASSGSIATCSPSLSLLGQTPRQILSWSARLRSQSSSWISRVSRQHSRALVFVPDVSL